MYVVQLNGNLTKWKESMKYDKKNNLGLEHITFYEDSGELMSLDQENHI